MIPDLKITQLSSLNSWKIKKRKIFSRYVKRNFVIFGILAFLHPFLIEIPAHADHISSFIAARWFVSLLLFSMAALETYHVLDFSSYTLLFSAVVLTPCFIQGLCLTLDPRLPLMFSVVVPLLFSSILFTSFFMKVVLYFLGTLIQWPFLKGHLQGSEVPTLVSVWLLGFMLLALFGFIYSSEVDRFQADQRLVEQVRKTQQLQEDFLLAVKGFVSKVIFDRIQKSYFRMGMNINDAVNEVLRLRKNQIAVVHSDIRSYTENSKEIDSYILQQAIPNIQAISELAEKNLAVTRLIGDLVLSYFEAEEGERSYDPILRAVKLGFEILDEMTILKSNKYEETEIRRYVLISFGLGLTGNIGAHNGGREVTCMGSPVNILSRIDRLTKKSKFSVELEKEPVLVLTEAAWSGLSSVIPNVENFRKITLNRDELYIEDFPEEHYLYLLPRSKDLYTRILISLGVTDE